MSKHKLKPFTATKDAGKTKFITQGTVTGIFKEKGKGKPIKVGKASAASANRSRKKAARRARKKRLTGLTREKCLNNLSNCYGRSI